MIVNAESNVAANVRRLRRWHNLSQRDLAGKVAGITVPQTISDIEAGNRRLTVTDLVRFADVFNVTVDALLYPDCKP